VVAAFAVLAPPRAWAAGSESRDDDEVNSEMVSVVEELELAMALACVYPLGLRDADGEDEGARCGAPLSGGAG
jgi:hypothetical protein